MKYLYLNLNEHRLDFAESCLALTPKVSLVGRHLYLEITATEKYFGGWEGWLARFESIRQAFEGEVTMSGVVVDRPEWGPALSPGQGRILFLPEGMSREALLQKNVIALLGVGDPAKLSEEEKDRRKLTDFLKRLGLYRIADFEALSPESVRRRFGSIALRLHDWVKGDRPLPLPPFCPATKLSEKVDAEEAPHQEGLVYLMGATLNRMEARLLGRSVLAKKITFTFRLENGTKRKDLELHEPSRNSKQLLKLFSGWLEGLTWDSPLQRVDVEISDTVAEGQRQLHLFDDEESRHQDLLQYLERLRNRLGDERAGFVRLKESYFPEKAWEIVPTPVQPPKPREFYPERPLYLFAPKPFGFAPERWKLVPTESLATHWWNHESPRQYYVAYGPLKEKLWIYKTQGSFFLHGEFC